jgi:hypothetical protein
MTIRAHRQKAASLWKRALFVLLLAVTAFSIACADTRAKRMDAWRGHPIDDLIVQWGAPVSTAKLTDGRMVYSWIAVHSVGRNYRSTFTVTKDGIIEDWSYHDASIPDYPK